MKMALSARVFIAAGLFATLAFAQGTLADYQRGQGLQARARGLVVNTPGTPNWIGDTGHLWYSRSVKGGAEFVWVDAAAGTRRPAFDHDRLASAISTASGGHYTALTLPFAPAPAGRGGGAGRGAAGPQPGALTFLDDERVLQFGAAGFLWKCTLADYTCTRVPSHSHTRGRRPRRSAPEMDLLAAPEMPGGDPVDGLEYLPPARNRARPPLEQVAGRAPWSAGGAGASPAVRDAAERGGLSMRQHPPRFRNADVHAPSTANGKRSSRTTMSSFGRPAHRERPLR